MTKTEQTEINIEKLAPELLLKRGAQVSIPAPLFSRIFGKKYFKLTMHHPTSRTLLKIAYEYSKMAMASEEMKLDEMVAHYRKHAKRVHRVVALGFLNSPRKNHFAGILAWYLRRRLTEQHFLYLYQLLMVHGGVEDFSNTIRLIGQTRITKPMNLSRKEAS